MGCRDMHRRIAGGLAASALALASSARGQAEEVRLEYQAIEGCPGPHEYVRQVLAYTEKVRFLYEGEGRRFRISVSRQGGAVQGRLTIEEQGQPAEREVSGASCAEVIEALALATALAIDPNALGGSEPQPEPQPEPEPKPQPEPQPEPEPKPEPPPPPEPEDATTFGWALGLTAMALGGVTPALAAGGAAFADLRLVRPSVLSPALVVGFDYTNSGLLGDDADDATYTIASARIGVCPVRFPAQAAFALEPCLAFQLGEISGEGAETLAIRRRAGRLWSAVELGLRARVTVTEPLFVQASGAVLSPLVDQEFVIDLPNGTAQSVHRVEPGASFSAALGIGATFE